MKRKKEEKEIIGINRIQDLIEIEFKIIIIIIYVRKTKK